MNDSKIEHSAGRYFGQQQLLADSIENFISPPSSRPDIDKALKPLTLELSQCHKSGSTFSSSEPAATAADSETPCVCARPSDPAKLCLSAAPRAWPLILQSNPSIVFSNSIRE